MKKIKHGEDFKMYRQAIGQKHARVYEEMMSKRRKTKTFEMIYIDYRSPFYEVMYRDNNGVSILDKTKNKAVYKSDIYVPIDTLMKCIIIVLVFGLASSHNLMGGRWLGFFGFIGFFWMLIPLYRDFKERYESDKK